ncbi:MAG: DUF4954 family protein [Spirochaetales bacterium]|nr:DUF4954 family protein [Spirochaetales bacterium]
MNDIKLVQLKSLGFNFTEKKYLPENSDEYHIRFRQAPSRTYRQLSHDEIGILKSRGNKADNWNNILVTENFSPNRVINNNFYGLNRIGDIDDVYLDFHDLHQPVGIYDSTIVSCDIGSNTAISNVNYLSHYIIGDTSIIINVNEMLTTDHAKFGNGIIKDGEEEGVRIQIELSNENGNRAVLPFDSMISGDAWLWSKFRDDNELMTKLKDITQKSFDSRRAHYGTIGENSVIKNCRIIKDVKVGNHAYIKGCNKLKNLTVNSSRQSSTQLGEGIELVNGIVGYGCRIFYGVKAIRFVMSDYSTLKYGARLINSFLGSNSTISCCEVLNSLIFPGHEQHHNNSFLCAATLGGQSNIASGATIGSNHNSRANDGEIQASRGFWPGLCTSLKHNSRFSSFNLLAKGSYPAEINNPLPFSLLSNDVTEGHLTIIPAYWFQYNLYALARNSWKYSVRDQRIFKMLNLEFDYLAPDTANEMFYALNYLKQWISETSEYKESEFDNEEKFLLANPDFTIEVESIENSKRTTRILKSGKAYKTYKDFILFYIIRNLVTHCDENNQNAQDIMIKYAEIEVVKWISLGGQLIREQDLDEIKFLIKKGELDNWDAIHKKYTQYASEYGISRLKHGTALYNKLFGSSNINIYCDKFIETCHFISEQTYKSRAKDYVNPFRLSTYDTKEEMETVVGKLEENSFIEQINLEMSQLILLAEKYLRQ